MILSRLSIERPLLATVISLLLMVFGVGSVLLLPVREFPDVDPPIVSVFTVFPGASAGVMDRDVTDIIEESVGTIQGIDTIKSISRDEVSRIQIEFDVGRDLDAATADVRDKLSQIRADLPADVEEPIVSKTSSDADPIIWLTLTSGARSRLELTAYADRFLVDRLAVISGVAQVIIGGGRRYAMRIWLDPDAMAARNITAVDIVRRLREQNVELPAGRIESADREFTVRTRGRLQTADEFRGLVLRDADGVQITMADVATVELGAESYRQGVRVDGEPAIGLGIVRQSKSNTLAVANAVKAEVDDIRETLPRDISIEVSFDASTFIEGAIREVLKTLLIAACLVIGVVLLFLRSPRSTLVPAVTVPVSLIAAFIVLYLLDFTINRLTLLALILGIGMVVDDGIVVLENVYRRAEKNEPRLLAATRGADQIGFAVVATTLVLVAVFVPMVFMPGDVGRLFGEFGMTLAAAVSFSSLVALTLGAMIASKVVEPKARSSGRFFEFFEKALSALERGYRWALERVVKVPAVVAVAAAVATGGVYWLYESLPRELAPVEDRGVIFIPVEAPEGATYAYTLDRVKEIEALLRREGGPILRTLSILGISQAGPGQVNQGFMIVRLKDWGERDISQESFADQLTPQLIGLPGIRAFPVNPPSLGLDQFQQPVQFVIAGTRFEDVQQWANRVLAEAEKMPELINPRLDYRRTKPQLRVTIDRKRAADLGLSVRDINETLSVLLGRGNVTEFELRSETYDVIPRATPQQRVTPEEIGNIFVRADSGDLVPLRGVVTVAERGVANELRRVNRLPAVTLQSTLAPGAALGDVLAQLEATAEEVLPAEHRIFYLGLSKEFQQSAAGVWVAFGLAFLIVFLVLAGQFESFIHPVIIMLPAPLAVSGGLLALAMAGQTLNVFSQIALILVIGLMAKNAILVVEFANQLRDRGMSVRDAMVDAASVRMRPILMTSVATALGAVPLALATGPGAESREVIGIVVIGGIVFATLLTLFVVPVLYLLLARFAKPVGAIAEQIRSLEEKESSG